MKLQYKKSLLSIKRRMGTYGAMIFAVMSLTFASNANAALDLWLQLLYPNGQEHSISATGGEMVIYHDSAAVRGIKFGGNIIGTTYGFTYTIPTTGLNSIVTYEGLLSNGYRRVVKIDFHYQDGVKRSAGSTSYAQDIDVNRINVGAGLNVLHANQMFGLVPWLGNIRFEPKAVDGKVATMQRNLEQRFNLNYNSSQNGLEGYMNLGFDVGSGFQRLTSLGYQFATGGESYDIGGHNAAVVNVPLENLEMLNISHRGDFVCQMDFSYSTGSHQTYGDCGDNNDVVTISQAISSSVEVAVQLNDNGDRVRAVEFTPTNHFADAPVQDTSLNGQMNALIEQLEYDLVGQIIGYNATNQTLGGTFQQFSANFSQMFVQQNIQSGIQSHVERFRDSLVLTLFRDALNNQNLQLSDITRVQNGVRIFDFSGYLETLNPNLANTINLITSVGLQPGTSPEKILEKLNRYYINKAVEEVIGSDVMGHIRVILGDSGLDMYDIIRGDLVDATPGDVMDQIASGGGENGSDFFDMQPVLEGLSDEQLQGAVNYANSFANVPEPPVYDGDDLPYGITYPVTWGAQAGDDIVVPSGSSRAEIVTKLNEYLVTLIVRQIVGQDAVSPSQIQTVEQYIATLKAAYLEAALTGATFDQTAADVLTNGFLTNLQTAFLSNTFKANVSTVAQGINVLKGRLQGQLASQITGLDSRPIQVESLQDAVDQLTYDLALKLVSGGSQADIQKIINESVLLGSKQQTLINILISQLLTREEILAAEPQETSVINVASGEVTDGLTFSSGDVISSVEYSTLSGGYEVLGNIANNLRYMPTTCVSGVVSYTSDYINSRRHVIGMSVHYNTGDIINMGQLGRNGTYETTIDFSPLTGLQKVNVLSSSKIDALSFTQNTDEEVIGCYSNPNFSPVNKFRALRDENSGLCLDVHGGNTADGTNLKLWHCNARDAQKWWYDETC